MFKVMALKLPYKIKGSFCILYNKRNFTMSIKTTIFSAILASVFFVSSASAAIITVTGSIDETLDGHHEIDYIFFDMLSSGTITFAASGQGSNFMGSDLDTYLTLANDSGFRSVGDIIARNDDGGQGFDSFLSQFLDIGTYIISVSSCCISPNEWVEGQNSSLTFDSQNPVYSLTINGDVRLSEVSAPTTLALLFLGMASVSFMRRNQ
jgi:hypothetical protein